MPYRIQFNKDAQLKDVELVEVPKPTIESGNQVLLRYILTPVNPSDLISIRGHYPGFKAESYPAVPGLEGVARVEEIGKDVTKVKVGQRVVRLKLSDFPAKVGTWQSYYLTDEEGLFVVPDEISDETAAQLLVNPISVGALLRVLQVPPNEYLLQSAAGSILGRLLIQFAKIKKIKTINLVRRKEQIEELKAIGADEVLCTSDGTDILAEVRKITNNKLAYGAIDIIGGELGITISECVRDCGTVLLFGLLGGRDFTANGFEMLFRGISYTGFWLTAYMKKIGAEETFKILEEVVNILIAHKIEPFAGKKYPLTKIHEAIAESLATGRGGKVLLVHE